MATAYKAVLTGATGAVGRYLVAELLASPAWAQVVVLGRRPWTPPNDSAGVGESANAVAGKLVQVQTDMEALTAGRYGEHFAHADAAFCTLGTTHAAAGSNEAFTRVDKDYVLATAKLARQAGTPYFAHVTADRIDNLFARMGNYGRTKLEAEAGIRELGFPVACMLRPPLLDRGEAANARPMERLALKLMKGMPVATVARAMRMDAEASLAGLRGQGGAGTSGGAGGAGAPASPSPASPATAGGSGSGSGSATVIAPVFRILLPADIEAVAGGRTSEA